MPRTYAWSQLRIGLAATAAALALSLAIFFVDRLSHWLEYRYRLRVYAESARNLAPGSPVWLAGIPVGRVWSVSFRGPETPVDRRIEIEARLRRGVRPLVTQGSTVRVVTAGLLGEAVLEITPPVTDAPTLPDGSGLVAGAPVDLPEVVAKLQVVRSLLPEATRRWAVVRARAARSEPLRALFRDGGPWAPVLTDLRALDAAFGADRGTLARLADDPRLVADLARIAERLAALADAASAGQGSLGRLTTDTLLGPTVAEVGRRAARIERALREGRGTAGRLLYDR
ncbi:MAG: MlaD family protein, partial [Gemmatimonadota bacterium]